MVKVDELKELLFKTGLYNVSKLNDFNFEINGEQEYLEYILKLELKLRQENSEKEHKRKSNLPIVTVDKKYSGIEEWNMNELLKLDWIEKCSNVIFVGKCGTGKTIAATQIGNKALAKGYKVYYTKVESFISVLKTKETLQKSKRIFEYLKQCDLIIIDDMMYIPLTEVELVMMYKAVMFLNESRSLMFITNRRLDEWRDAQEGSHTIETLVDRILTYSKIITFK